MRLPFYYTITLRTKLSKSEVKDILYHNTITNNGKTFKDKRVEVTNTLQFKTTQTNYLYKAKINDTKFKLYRVLEGPSGSAPSNSFNPLCFGKLYQDGSECIIKLKFRSVIFVLAFTFIWFSAALFGVLAILVRSLHEGKYQDVLFAIILALPFYMAFWFFNKYGFRKEVNKILHYFTEIRLTPNGR